MSGCLTRSVFTGRLPGALAAVVAAMIGLSVVGFMPILSVFAQSRARGAAEFEPLEIVTASGTHRFQVEVARTDVQRERGLMFRRYLPPDRGMLFDFKTEQPVMMWMKNTYLPLDMLFISRSGVITSIAENTEPLSERVITSGGPVYAVLEINAGAAARINAKPGDRVVHALFRP